MQSKKKILPLKEQKQNYLIKNLAMGENKQSAFRIDFYHIDLKILR